jgi:ectoine hydroxylase-related dioxygenase (phytanoyl-CoA dioxygenase family)
MAGAMILWCTEPTGADGCRWRIFPIAEPTKDRRMTDAVYPESKLAQYESEFHRDGYTLLRGAFASDEIDILREAIVSDDGMTTQFQNTQAKFKSGKYPSFETIRVWNDTSGNDVFAKFTRSAKIMDVLERVFADDIYVYHNKVALKYPEMPGFKYHQDYYYWYGMGCLYPDLATCFIAVDPATRKNGCLRLIRGSHRLGRIEHKMFDGVSDSSADPERLAVILERLPEDDIELAAGDAVIFHCNTLHASDTNASAHSRLALLGCYNTRRNDPFIRNHDHPNYIPQSKIYDRIVRADLAVMPDFSLHYRDQ